MSKINYMEYIYGPWATLSRVKEDNKKESDVHPDTETVGKGLRDIPLADYLFRSKIPDRSTCQEHMKKLYNVFSTKQSNHVKGGFAAEHHHAHTFTENAKSKGLSIKAELATKNNPETDVLIKDGDKVIGRNQCKISGNPKYINNAAKNPKYEGNVIIKNTDNTGGKGLYNVSDHIDVGGAKSTPITKGEACNMNHQSKCCVKTNVFSKDTAASVGMATLLQGVLSAANNAVGVYKGGKSLTEACTSTVKHTGVSFVKNTALVTASKTLAKQCSSEVAMTVVPFIGPALDTTVAVSRDLYQTGRVSWETWKYSLINTGLTAVYIVLPAAAPVIVVSQISAPFVPPMNVLIPFASAAMSTVKNSGESLGESTIVSSKAVVNKCVSEGAGVYNLFRSLKCLSLK